MPKSSASQEYKRRQNEHMRQVPISEPAHQLLKEYAAANNMSVSEAAREAMALFARGEIVPLRKRLSKRVNIWLDDPSLYTDFTKEAAERGVTLSVALEATLEEMM